MDIVIAHASHGVAVIEVKWRCVMRERSLPPMLFPEREELVDLRAEWVVPRGMIP